MNLLAVAVCAALHLSMALSPVHPPTKLSKFAGLQAGDAAPFAQSWPALEFQEVSKEHNRLLTCILPDDDCPDHAEHRPPLLHNRRALHYTSLLLSPQEVALILETVQGSTFLFQERESRCIVAVEDGVPQRNSLSETLVPLLDNKIVPFARKVLCQNNVVVADALVRCYDPAESREALAPHYDITAYASVIVPLTLVEGGLYVQSGGASGGRREIDFVQPGDAVLHKYDVMHGVHVRKGVRFSLVVWLVEEQEDAFQSSTIPSWIQRDSTSSVHAAFLYANALIKQYGDQSKEMAKAKTYYKWAAERGHAHSQYVLAMLLCSQLGDGNTLRDDNPRVVELLSMASDCGVAMAQHELGTMHKHGYCGLEVNLNMARRYYELASEQGYGRSAQMLQDETRWIPALE